MTRIPLIHESYIQNKGVILFQMCDFEIIILGLLFIFSAI